jgi:hypothetical protein
VTVTVDIPERRYDPQLEATAYFVVAEALTNVARYADASAVRVAADEEAGQLVVTITDDGRGGADPAAGSGLRGLSDRLAAIDGQLTISSPPGGGTIVRAEIPLAALDSPTMSVPVSADYSVLARVRAVPEARAVPRLRGGVRLSSPVFLIMVAAVAIVVVALIAAVPLFEERPITGRADDFIRPFDYVIPAGSNARLVTHSDHLQVFLSPGSRLGLSVWAVDDVLVDHCPPKRGEPPGAVGPRQPGVDGLLAYLRSVDGLHVSPMGYRTIDQRQAVRVDLAVGKDVVCPTGPRWLYLWRDTSPRGEGDAMQVCCDGWLPLAILDVDGQTVVFELWSSEDWAPTGEKIVDSIRFAYRPPPLSPASPTRTP